MGVLLCHQVDDGTYCHHNSTFPLPSFALRVAYLLAAAVFVLHNTITGFFVAPNSWVCAHEDVCECGFPLVDQLCEGG